MNSDIKFSCSGFWFFLLSIPLSAAFAIYAAAGCTYRTTESYDKKKIEYYKAMAPIAQEWAKQGVKDIKIN